jgi:hypothetical protein
MEQKKSSRRIAQSGYIAIASPGGGRGEAGLEAQEVRPPEIDGRKLGPRLPMLVDQGFVFGASDAKTRARSLYSKLGKVLALTGVLVQPLSRAICSQPQSYPMLSHGPRHDV